MASPIECLPVEVFELIASDLDLPAYRNLRLSSRQLHTLSFSIFAKRYFGELTTTLGSPSLERLVGVSSHGYLSDFVKTLDITILSQYEYTLMTEIDRVGVFPPPKRFPRVSGVSLAHISREATLYDDVSSPKYPQCIVEPLTRSLRAFRNLTAVKYRARHREPTKYDFPISQGDRIFRTKCFDAVFDAIVKSDIQLETFAMAKVKQTALPYKCANLPYTILQSPTRPLSSLQRCFSQLQTLVFSLDPTYDEDSRVSGWQTSLSKLIAYAPNLKHMTLSLERRYRFSRLNRPLRRPTRISQRLTLSCRLDFLQTLRLVNCSVREADLADFVNAHGNSLQDVFLANVLLSSGTWSSFWATLKNVEGLRLLRLSSLKTEQDPVFFRKKDNKRSKITLDADKSGLAMAAMLDNLVVWCETDIDYTMDGIVID
jgi:hypothetical protein